LFNIKGIGYVLYQKHPGNTRVVRFGSKALNHWQKSYGPTKLELLGVVTSITFPVAFFIPILLISLLTNSSLMGLKINWSDSVFFSFIAFILGRLSFC
jgi:hypothetical protein